jgi:hypothetical protein
MHHNTKHFPTYMPPTETDAKEGSSKEGSLSQHRIEYFPTMLQILL